MNYMKLKLDYLLGGADPASTSFHLDFIVPVVKHFFKRFFFGGRARNIKLIFLGAGNAIAEKAFTTTLNRPLSANGGYKVTHVCYIENNEERRSSITLESNEVAIGSVSELPDMFTDGTAYVVALNMETVIGGRSDEELLANLNNMFKMYRQLASVGKSVSYNYIGDKDIVYARPDFAQTISANPGLLFGFWTNPDVPNTEIIPRSLTIA